MGLLSGAVEWLRSGSAPFEALAAKAAVSTERGYLGWIGGLPAPAFESLGFERLASFEDPYFLAGPDVVPPEAAVERPARFHLMLLRRG